MFHPDEHRGQDFAFEFGHVSYEIIIDDKDLVSPAAAIEVVEFGEHLRDGFFSHFASEGLGDIAEVTGEGAASRVLHRHHRIFGYVGKFPERDGRAAEFGFLVGGVDSPEAASLEVGQELWEGDFGFTEDEVVNLRPEFGYACEEGSASDDFLVESLCAADDLFGGIMLDGHASDEDIVGPLDGFVREALYGKVDEFFFPFFGQHCGNGEEAERGEEGFFRKEPEGVFEVPECVGAVGGNQQYLHRFIPCASIQSIGQIL